MLGRIHIIIACLVLIQLVDDAHAADKADPQTDEIEQLFNAVSLSIAFGDETGVIAEIKEHPELIRYRHPRSGPLLMQAAAWGRTRIAKYLMFRGADPNESFRARTSLHICLMLCTTAKEFPEKGRQPIDLLPVFDALLSQGADPKKCEISGGEPFAQTGTRPTIPSEEPLLSLGVKLQIIGGPNTQARSRLLARLRDHMGLPVDALLPLNSDSLYQDLYRGRDLSTINIPQQ